jgi:hypothetical protein
VSHDHAQNMAAIELATSVRVARAAIKREIDRGERDICSVIMRVPFGTDNMSIMELLCAQRRWGMTRARKLLYRNGGMSDSKPLHSLTARQRSQLVSDLKGEGGFTP